MEMTKTYDLKSRRLRARYRETFMEILATARKSRLLRSIWPYSVLKAIAV